MRKPVHERSTGLKLHEVPDDHDAILPCVRLVGSENELTVQVKGSAENSYNNAITIREPEGAEELRDQLDAWIEQYDGD